MCCYDRRQLSFGHFNAGCRTAGERVDLAIRSGIGFALLPAFKPSLRFRCLQSRIVCFSA